MRLHLRRKLGSFSKIPDGRAYAAVQGELHTLPSVLATLWMLFGQPTIVNSALINSTKNEPQLKTDDLEILVTFLMSVKTLCNALPRSFLEAIEWYNELYNDG